MGEGQALAALALRHRKQRRLSFVNAQPLPCRVSEPGQAGVTLPSFPQLSQLDFAWLMNCDGTQLQGCWLKGRKKREKEKRMQQTSQSE